MQEKKMESQRIENKPINNWNVLYYLISRMNIEKLTPFLSFSGAKICKS